MLYSQLPNNFVLKFNKEYHNIPQILSDLEEARKKFDFITFKLLLVNLSVKLSSNSPEAKKFRDSFILFEGVEFLVNILWKNRITGLIDETNITMANILNDSLLILRDLCYFVITK